MRSLRSQLLLGTATGTTLVLLASSALLYALISRALWSEYDASLATKLRSLAVMVEQEGGQLELDFHEAHLPEFERADRPEFYQAWLSGGEVLARSRSLGNRDLELLRSRADVPAFKSVTLPDGRAGRIVGITFVPHREHEQSGSDQPLAMTLVIGRGTAGIASTLGRVGLLLISVCLVAVLVTAGVLAWSVRRGLRPVARLSAQIANVGAANLTARLDGRGVPTELAPVVDRLNDLLARLDAAFQRERRFTGDVAHELRTPLAGVRSLLEVALSRERDPDAYREVMGGCLKINLQMQQMVDNLLNLARADAGQLAVEREMIDVPDLIRECWKPLQEKADARGLSIEWRLDEPGTVETDREKLSLVLQNILDNAVTHASDAGDVRITTRAEHDTVVLTVSNSRSSLSADDLQHVFDRFWRGDLSRRVFDGHCGLGLPLCQSMIEQLEGSIEANATVDGMFTLTIRLPRTGTDTHPRHVEERTPAH